MMPEPYWQVAKVLHEERIRAAEAPRPERTSEATRGARRPLGTSTRQRLRMAVAHALREFTTNIEPTESTRASA